MSNGFLSQAEIDAILNAQGPEPYQPAEDAKISIPLEPTGVESTTEQNALEVNGVALGTEQSVIVPELLTDVEKDALGEVGNICMGSSSTTLSLLLNQPVNITSPRVTITTMEELTKRFDIPHMSIYVHYTEGLSGYNLLLMKLQDASVLADLMMGGNGTSISEELTEISISAASEAMNQMIGAASTAMATMFNRTVNISPPETKIFYNADELEKFPELGQMVVVWFKMTINSILDTQIMQVMNINTAREQAGLILGQLLEVSGKEYLPVQEESQAQDLSDHEEEAGRHKVDDVQELYEPEPTPPATATQASNDTSCFEPQSRAETSSVRPPTTSRPVAPLGPEQERLGLILDIPLKVTVLLGRARWPIKEILELTPGSIVELQSLVDEPVEVLVNGTLVAMGEVVVVNENFGVRLTNIIKPEERLQNLGKS